MQSIRFECLAGEATRDARNGAGARGVNSHHNEQENDSEPAGTQVCAVEEQALESFPNNVKRGEEQEAGFDKGGEAFEFGMTVGVVGVGGLVGDTNREKGDDGGDEVEAGMQRFRENAQTAGAKGKENLERDEDESAGDRRERRQSFLSHGLRRRIHGEAIIRWREANRRFAGCAKTGIVEI